ncbi:MAG: hypothetical protein IT269_07385 [Saprospiraceae bacterium]|nr:hypothetical protein [Saprospiraceae bacterium]
MMYKSLFLLFTALLSWQHAINAQDLINNKDIVWIGEYESNMAPKPMECWYVNNPAPFDYRFHLVKWQSQGNKQGYFGSNEYDLCEWLTGQIMKNIENDNAECYADAKLEQRLSHDDVLSRMSSIDTVVTFDPNTYEERVYIVRNQINVEDVQYLRVKYRAFYNEKKRSFGAEMLAYAPMVKDRSNPDQNQPPKTKPLCWIKAPKAIPATVEQIIQQPDINWAAQYKGNLLPFDSFHIVKQQKDLRSIVLREAQSPVNQAYNYQFEPLSQKEIDQAITTIDTVVTFDPETYEEKITVAKRDILSNIKSINFVFLWYYDSRKKLLYAKPTFSQILEDMSDDAGTFRYSKPFFYQKIE